MAGRELEELFGIWRSEPVPPQLLPGVGARAGTAVVAAALRSVAVHQRRRSGVRSLGIALTLAAALTGLGIGAWFELRPAPVARSFGSSVVVGDARGDVAVTDGEGGLVPGASAIAEGYGVRTEDGSATLTFPSGASARVARESSLAILRAKEQEALFLARGGVDVEVPRLEPARGFSVQTPDALVTVHGTRFSVLVEPMAGDPLTHVHVTHGIVSVRKDGHEVFLTAGQTWPPADAVRAPTPAVAEPLPADADVRLAGDDEADATQPSAARKATRGARPTQGNSRKFDAHELADQNERFAQAMAAKKRGDPTQALRELADILRRYPGSPLSQELRVERLRLLRGTGSSELAAREAKRYLREFPGGYAVAEAEHLLLEQP
jgi:FecR protein